MKLEIIIYISIAKSYVYITDCEYTNTSQIGCYSITCLAPSFNYQLCSTENTYFESGYSLVFVSQIYFVSHICYEFVFSFQNGNIVFSPDCQNIDQWFNLFYILTYILIWMLGILSLTPIICLTISYKRRVESQLLSEQL